MSECIRFVPMTDIRQEMEIAQWFVRQQLLQPSRFALARRNEMARLSPFSRRDAQLIGASKSKAV
jgi:hypothetical protein